MNGPNILDSIVYENRIKTILGKNIDINKKKLEGHQKLIKFRKRRRNKKMNSAISRDIKAFLEREDNSRLLPGKANANKRW